METHNFYMVLGNLTAEVTFMCTMSLCTAFYGNVSLVEKSMFLFLQILEYLHKTDFKVGVD